MLYVSPESFIIRRTVVNMSARKTVRCCNHLFSTDNSICNHRSNRSDIIERFSAEEVSNLLTKMKPFLKKWKLGKVRLNADFGQRKQLHTGVAIVMRNRRRNIVRRAINSHRSGVQEFAK